MPRLLLPLVAAAALVPLASAGIKWISPEAGATLTAGTAISVEWEDDGKEPKLADMLTYQLSLMAGGNKVDTFVSLHPVTITCWQRVTGATPQGGPSRLTLAQQLVASITTSGSFAVSNRASGLVGVAVGEDSPENA